MGAGPWQGATLPFPKAGRIFLLYQAGAASQRKTRRREAAPFSPDTLLSYGRGNILVLQMNSRASKRNDVKKLAGSWKKLVAKGKNSCESFPNFRQGKTFLQASKKQVENFSVSKEEYLRTGFQESIICQFSCLGESGRGCRGIHFKINMLVIFQPLNFI